MMFQIQFHALLNTFENCQWPVSQSVSLLYKVCLKPKLSLKYDLIGLKLVTSQYNKSLSLSNQIFHVK